MKKDQIKALLAVCFTLLSLTGIFIIRYTKYKVLRRKKDNEKVSNTSN